MRKTAHKTKESNMPTQTICPTCESTLRTNTCDSCEFTSVRTPIQALYANATVPTTHRHRNDLPFARRTFEAAMSTLLDTNREVFV